MSRLPRCPVWGIYGVIDCISIQKCNSYSSSSSPEQRMSSDLTGLFVNLDTAYQADWSKIILYYSSGYQVLLWIHAEIINLVHKSHNASTWLQAKLSYKRWVHDLADLASLQMARIPSCDCAYHWSCRLAELLNVADTFSSVQFALWASGNRGESRDLCPFPYRLVAAFVCIITRLYRTNTSNSLLSLSSCLLTESIGLAVWKPRQRKSRFVPYVVQADSEIERIVSNLLQD